MAKGQNRNIYPHLYGLLLATGGLVFGVGVGTFTTFFPHYIKQVGNYEPEEFGSIKSYLGLFFTIGALIACVTGSFIMEILGRYLSILVFLVVEMFAILAMAYPNIRVMYGLRLVTGYCACFWTLSLPGMIFEVLPSNLAGAYAGLFGAFLTGGIGIGFCFGHSWTEKYWQVVICWPAVWEGIRFVLFLTWFRIRSPVWLVEHNAPRDKIIKQYEFLYEPSKAEKLAIELEEGVVKARKETPLTWENIVSRKYAIQIFLAVLLNVLNQMTGINLFAFYCKDIFDAYKFKNATELSIGFTVMGVISSLIVTFIAVKISIRKIIIFGLFLQGLGHFVLLCGIVFAEKARSLIILGPYVYSYGYSHALGGLMYAYCNVVVPAKVMPYCVAFQWVLCCIIVKFILPIRNLLKDLKMFFVFQVFTIIGAILFIGYSVEVKDVPRDEVLPLFNKKKFFS